MLQPAKLYEEQWKAKMAMIQLDEEYKYAYSTSYRDAPKLEDSTWNRHQFVSVNEKGDVMGYFSYMIDRDTRCVSGLQVFNFHKKGLGKTFGQDLQQLVKDIFFRFGFHKLSFSVIIGNPVEAFYDRYIDEIGGRIVGFYQEDARLLDGKLYDIKIYEVLGRNFEEAMKTPCSRYESKRGYSK